MIVKSFPHPNIPSITMLSSTGNCLIEIIRGRLNSKVAWYVSFQFIYLINPFNNKPFLEYKTENEPNLYAHQFTSCTEYKLYIPTGITILKLTPVNR